MSTAEWDDAREQGKEDKKWLLVNLQDNSIFQCQTLNRDVWKDAAVQRLQYVTFYFPGAGHENADNFPHVAIVDPRTGEQVKVWSGVPFPSADDFHAQLAEFLDRYSLDASKKNPVAKDTAKRPKVIDVDRMTEDEMLEMALQNSMNTSGGAAAGAGAGGSGSGSGSASTPRSNVVDPDALTKEAAAAATEGEVHGTSAAAASGFARIASDRPHTEPANDPKTTTRIQFRLPTGGRVIRRFSVDDAVRRIFEWLKAEPLEGRAGVDFELKQMPQGQDLLHRADQTILEAGLKQGTVMVEFLEE
ncbi:UBX domain-containing protein 5 like [Verticillium longisporum]|nr:UBX domain-containing protein 5 like [Verticillium longisporum]